MWWLRAALHHYSRFVFLIGTRRRHQYAARDLSLAPFAMRHRDAPNTLLEKLEPEYLNTPNVKQEHEEVMRKCVKRRIQGRDQRGRLAGTLVHCEATYLIAWLTWEYVLYVQGSAVEMQEMHNQVVTEIPWSYSWKMLGLLLWICIYHTHRFLTRWMDLAKENQ
ncbi:hypothetical protein E2P81_ATG08952 [Venturia nashicola]|uniref:Uncharacterized protein n=1 Tax=Venturia nashicola TaxID=86259 RepID=A0A4Z1NN76_9PEZI|nr:hypothetical protein E6O75_ATG09151 [Venturia nashicola]TLD23608.1 hypothetical protein E2P81_ATG08952 [Venturia nashicola]